MLASSLIIATFLAWSAGSNNAANLVAAAVGARVIRLKSALLIATVFEVVGSVLLGWCITSTLSIGIVNVDSVPSQALSMGMLSAMFAAGIWILVASLLRVPISVNETVVAGIVGFGLSVSLRSVQWWRVAFIYVSRFLMVPLSGLLAFTLKKLFARKLENPKTLPAASNLSLFAISVLVTFSAVVRVLDYGLSLLVALILGGASLLMFNAYVSGKSGDPLERVVIYEKTLSAIIVGLMALSHGASNAGIVVGPLMNVLLRTYETPNEGTTLILLLISGSLMSLGIISWGRRVVGTLGEELTTLSYPTAIISYFSASTTVMILAQLGVPAATTMAVTGSIVGVGFAEGYSAVNSRVLKKILVLWLVTTPACIVFSYTLFNVATYFTQTRFT